MAVPTPEDIERQKAIHELRDLSKQVIRQTNAYLRAEGYELRMGAELNVFLEGKDGKPIKPESIDLQTAIERQSKSPLMKRLSPLKDITSTGLTPVEFASQAGDSTSKWEPMYVANHLHMLRQDLPGLAASYGANKIRMDAKPYPNMPDTCGMHINFSLWKGGQNLFIHPNPEKIKSNFSDAPHTLIEKYIVSSLLEFQKEGLLGFAPTENSFARYDNYKNFGTLTAEEKKTLCENASPNAIAVDNDRRLLAESGTKLAMMQAPPLSPSINVHTMTPKGIAVRKQIGKPEMQAENCRIESRLAGADSDPYVVIALMMMAIVKGVEKQKDPLKPYGKGQPIPKTHAEAKETLKNSFLIKDTFGEAFQQTMLTAYGSGQALPPPERAIGRSA